MRKCGECKKTYHEDEAIRERVNLGEYQGMPDYRTIETCPHCGSDDFYEVEQCAGCDEWFTSRDLEAGFCNECCADIEERVAKDFGWTTHNNYSKQEQEYLKSVEDWRFLKEAI